MKKEEYYLNRRPIWILKRTHSSSKMAKQQLRTLTVLAEDLCLVPSTRIKRLKIAYNSRSKGSDAQFRPPWAHTGTWKQTILHNWEDTCLTCVSKIMEVCQICAVHEQKRIRIQDVILENLPSGTSDSAGLSYACISGGKRHAIYKAYGNSKCGGGVSQMQQRRRAVGSSTHFEKYSLAGH